MQQDPVNAQASPFVAAFRRYHGKATVSLVLILLSTIAGWYWPWGALLLYWTASDLISGQTWLSETVTRRASPVLYSLILITWFVFGVYLIYADIIY